jgi:hypothetical protein
VPGGLIYLEIADERSSTNWIWRLHDGEGWIEAEAAFSPIDPQVQLLLDRDALDPLSSPLALRQELTRIATLLLTEPIARRMHASQAPGLLVSGPPPARLALSLPYELLFGSGDPSRIVVRHVRHPLIAKPRSDEEAVLSAFSLLTEDPYLPLHDEAATLAELCRSLGISLEELFICFTAEHALERSRGATIVHFAGHGQRGIWRCVGHDHSSREVSSHDLIAAWAELPPRLVVLNFCESSSERESSDLVGAMTRGGIAQWRHESQTHQSSPEHSTSMALDLVSALPVAVLALRSPIDDFDARKLVHTFYRLHLRDGHSLIDAYSMTLAEVPSYDDFGMPTPALYIGGGDPDLLAPKPPSGDRAQQTCLSRRHRHCTNLYYQTFSALSPTVERNWTCLIEGNEDTVGDLVEDAVREMLDLPYLRGQREEPRAIEVSRFDHCRLLRHTDDPELAAELFSVTVDRLADDVVPAELFSACPAGSRDELQALDSAICDLPALLLAVLRNDIEQLASAARDALADRDPLLDRSVAWDVADSLLRHLPDSESIPISAWAEERWHAVIATGPPAIELVAAWHIHNDNWFLHVDLTAICAALGRRMGAPPTDLYDTALSLHQGGVMSFGAIVVAHELQSRPSTDGLTTAHAWAECSEAGAAAHVESLVTLSQDPYGTFDSLPSRFVAALATLAHVAGDARWRVLKDEWERRIGSPLNLASRPAWSVSADGHEDIIDSDPRHAYGHGFLDLRFFTSEGRTPEVPGGDPKYRVSPFDDDERSFYGSSAWRLAADVERIPAVEVIREAARLDSLVLAQLDGVVHAGHETRHASLIFDRLCELRWMLANALVEIGQRDVAIEVMRSLFRRVRRTRVDPLTTALTGFATITFLRQEKSYREARAICDELLAMPVGLLGSPGAIVALIANVEMLTVERRSMSLKPAAVSLLSEVAAWREPTKEVARRALLLGALYGKGLLMQIDAEHLVVCVLALLANGVASFAAPEVPWIDGVLGFWATRISPAEVTAAAQSVSYRFQRVLDVLSVTPDQLCERALAYHEHVIEEPIRPDDAGLEPLEKRAAAGCWLASCILSRLGGNELPVEPDDYFETIPAIARASRRLRDACPAFYNDSVRVLLPPLVKAFEGDVESRFVLVGLVADELHPDRVSPKLLALFALAHGNADNALAVAGNVREPTELAEIGMLIEGVALGAQCLEDATPTSREIVDLSIERWRLIITADPSDRMRVGISSVAFQVAVRGKMVPLLLEAASRAVPTTQLIGLSGDAPVARAVLALLDATPNAQIVLATIELMMSPDIRGPVASLLGPLRTHDDELVAWLAWGTLLVAHMEKEDREEAERDLDEILAFLQRGERRRESALAAVLPNLQTMVGIGWPDLAVTAASRIEQAGGGQLNGFALWYLAAGRFAALVALDCLEEASSCLRDVGMRLGMPAACAVLLGGGIADFGDPATAELASVMMSLQNVGEPDGAPAEWGQARSLLANRLVDADHWQDVHRLLTGA